MFDGLISGAILKPYMINSNIVNSVIHPIGFLVMLIAHTVIHFSCRTKGRSLSINLDLRLFRRLYWVVLMALLKVCLTPDLGCFHSCFSSQLVVTIWFGVNLVSWKVLGLGRGYASVLLFVPALLGSILVSTLPSHNKTGLLFSYWISSRFFFMVVLQVHLKRLLHIHSFCFRAICDSPRMGWFHRIGTYKK